jgi:hypothetical protein
MNGRCIVPWCNVTGAVTPGRLYACTKHTRYLVTGYRTAVKVGSAVLDAATERYAKKQPWWAQAALEGIKRAR